MGLDEEVWSVSEIPQHVPLVPYLHTWIAFVHH